MNNDPVHSLRRMAILLPVLGLVALAGCATAPEEEAAPEPVAETSPLVMEPVAVVEMAKPAAPVVLAANHPERYVVVKGDTLWEISERFLRDPWRWPEVWQDNPQVANPHLIFPGDVLTLMMINGKPVIHVERGALAQAAGVTSTPVDSAAAVVTPLDSSGRPLKVVKLSPQVREIDLEKAIPTISMDAIRQFLNQSMVVELQDMERAPYVVAFADEHMAGGSGYRIYAQGIKDPEPGNYMVVHPNKEYLDPDTGEKLGHEAIFLANADIERMSDPVTMMLHGAKREVLRGDRLIPGNADPLNHSFMPHPPASEVKGKIISVFDAVNQIGQHQVVVLNLGRREGMEPGHVLAAYQDGEMVRDEVAGKMVKLPDERAGIIMVFRTFDKVSYGLVMRATRAIHLYDTVTNP